MGQERVRRRMDRPQSGREVQRLRKERRKQRRRKRFLQFLGRVLLLLLCIYLFLILLRVAEDFWNLLWNQGEENRTVVFVEEIEDHLQELSEEKAEREELPESLLELLEKNPEAREFVENYPENRDKEWNRDVSKEVTEGEIPLFLQWDERWGYETYGGDFLAVTGCGPTCLSMMICGLTGETQWNPYEVARWAEEQGYYVEGTGSAWDLMVSGAESFGLTSEEVVFDEVHILAALKSGRLVVCAMRPGDFTTGGHFLVLTGVDEKGDILLHDPNSPKKSSKSWQLSDLMPQIKNLWAISN